MRATWFVFQSNHLARYANLKGSHEQLISPQQVLTRLPACPAEKYRRWDSNPHFDAHPL